MGGAHISNKRGFQRFCVEGGANPPRGHEEMSGGKGEGVCECYKVGRVV
jgi:hypothetical protein